MKSTHKDRCTKVCGFLKGFTDVSPTRNKVPPGFLPKRNCPLLQWDLRLHSARSPLCAGFSSLTASRFSRSTACSLMARCLVICCPDLLECSLPTMSACYPSGLGPVTTSSGRPSPSTLTWGDATLSLSHDFASWSFKHYYISNCQFISLLVYCLSTPSPRTVPCRCQWNSCIPALVTSPHT